MITPSSASPSIAYVALAPEPNDPLAGLPFMHVWRDCLRQARIGNKAKLVLLMISLFVDGEGEGSSYSYAKLAWDCNLSESTVKSIIGKLLGVWLEYEHCGGQRLPGIGRENLYKVSTPVFEVEALRAHRLKTLQNRSTKAVKSGSKIRQGPSKFDTYLSTDIQYSNSRESTPGAVSAEWRNGIDPNYGHDLPDEEAGQ